MSIYSKLFQALYDFPLHNYPRDPSLILIHPATLEKFINEMRIEGMENVDIKNANEMRIRGCRVYRSVDVSENDIIVK